MITDVLRKKIIQGEVGFYKRRFNHPVRYKTAQLHDLLWEVVESRRDVRFNADGSFYHLPFHELLRKTRMRDGMGISNMTMKRRWGEIS